MKNDSSIHFCSTCGKYGVSFKPFLLKEMLKECILAGHNETGGIVWGKYNATCDEAIIAGFSKAPSDSKMNRYSFMRGIAGLQKLLKSLWAQVDREYYLGEWHFHPFASAMASSVDVQQMFVHANDRKLQCPEPIMLIIGGNPSGDWHMTVSVYTRAGSMYSLKPQNEDCWKALLTRCPLAWRATDAYKEPQDHLTAASPGPTIFFPE